MTPDWLPLNSKYFDHNATTPLCAAAREAWLEAAERFWHNPSSLYPDAGATKRRLEDAREGLADALGLEDESALVFTSGATEANNSVFSHFARHFPDGRCAISATEHPSALAPARRHFGERLDEVPALANGSIDLEALREILARGETVLVSVMAANNETGVIQPIAAALDLARERGVATHNDATQWFGKRPAAGMSELADFTVASAHKFGGPKGVGFVHLSDSACQLQFQTGGPQESRHRAGTEDLPGIAAMIAALEDAEKRLGEMAAQSDFRDAFEKDIAERVSGTYALARDTERLPNTSMVVMPQGKNLKWLTRLGRRGFAISTGSACSSGAESGSHVLAAMGIADDELDRALRISSGAGHSSDDWAALARAIGEVWAEMRGRADGSKPTLDLGRL